MTMNNKTQTGTVFCPGGKCIILCAAGTLVDFRFNRVPKVEKIYFGTCLQGEPVCAVRKILKMRL